MSVECGCESICVCVGVFQSVSLTVFSFKCMQFSSHWTTVFNRISSQFYDLWLKLKLWNCSAQEYCFSSKYKCFRYTHVHTHTHTPVLKVIIFSFVSVMTCHSNLSLHTWADSGVGLVVYWPHWEHNANGETKLDQGKRSKASSS